MKKITITVSASGTITAESSGQPGPGCINDLATIQALLPGTEIADSRLMPEYFLSSNAQQIALQQIVQNESGQ